MAIDMELISSETFNLKFKNRLRDFYVYQFKSNETEFFDKGSFLNARLLAGCILVNKYDISENELFAIQMKDIHIDPDMVMPNIMYGSESEVGFASVNKLDKKDEIIIHIGNGTDNTALKEVVIKNPFSQMIFLLCNRNATDLFLTGNTNRSIPDNIVSKFHDALNECGNLRYIDDYELFDKWRQLYLSTVNNAVKYGTFYNDSQRLRNVIEYLAGVEWKKGELVDLEKGEIVPNKENIHIECITIDGRSIINNPFQELYKCCAENSTQLGQGFLMTYFLILHFHIASFYERYDYHPFKKKEIEAINLNLSEEAARLESIARRRKKNVNKSWSSLSEKDKQLFGNLAIERFNLYYATNKEKDAINDIYEKVLINNRRIVLKDEHFVLEDTFPFQPQFIEKNVLYKLYAKYVTGKKIDEKQFGNNLYKLTRLGVLMCKKQKDKLFYSLSNVFLRNIFGYDEDFRVRFAEMLSFFSQVLPLGEVGKYILTRITNKPVTCIRFKHNYLKRALDDFNIIDLLNAIEQKMWIEIEYRNAAVVDLKYQRFVCFPLEIRESVNDGRQYLLFYHPDFRSVSAVRIEFIDSVKIGTINEKPFVAEDLERAEKLIAYTWGTAFNDFKTGNVNKKIEINHVRVVVKCEKNEFYIKNRVQRECRGFISINSITDEEYGNCLELVVELANFEEFLRWVRSLMCRVVSVEVNGSEYIQFYDDVINMARKYNLTKCDRLCHNEQIMQDKEVLIEFKNGFKEIGNIHDLLFHELFSEPFYKIGCVLFDLLNQDEVNKTEILKNYSKYLDPSVANDRKKQLEVVINAFITSQKRKKSGTFFEEYEDVTTPVFKFKSNSNLESIWDLIPLTKVEIQWIQNVICHPLAKCFLSSNELKRIKYSLPKTNLFNINKTVLYDQFLDIEGFYAKFESRTIVRTILQAIREKKTLDIQYQDQYKELSSSICYPSHIEYSKRDNKFRLRGISDNKVKTFNIERIQNISITDSYFDHNSVLDQIKKYDEASNRSINVCFNEVRNIPDRILTEFSCFNKKCLKCGENRYRMTLFYNEDDAKEILIRLLSYGPYIYIDEDNGTVKEEYLERIKRQLDLVKSREIVREHVERKVEEQR